VDGQPCLLEQIWLPLPRFAALIDGDPADWGDLLYPAFAERCGVRVQRAVDEIGFAPLSAVHARPLGLTAGHPAAVVTRSAFDLAGRCVEHRITRGDANAFHYTVTLT
jgi:GntR family transcriptional regulator